MRDKLQNNINHIIQHQISHVIKKIFAGKKQNVKKLKSVQNVLDNPDPSGLSKNDIQSGSGSTKFA